MPRGIERNTTQTESVRIVSTDAYCARLQALWKSCHCCLTKLGRSWKPKVLTPRCLANAGRICWLAGVGTRTKSKAGVRGSSFRIYKAAKWLRHE